MSSIRAVTWRATARVIAIAGLGLALTSAAQAQITEAQKNAMRSSCRSDYMANCMSVPPGGKEAFECLKSHLPKLSPACQHAVNAVTPPGAAKPAVVTAPPPPAKPKSAVVAAPPPPAPPPQKKAAVQPSHKAAAVPALGLSLNATEQKALREHCGSDFAAHCVGITPGTEVALQCLQRNEAHLSPACRQVVSETTPHRIAVAAPPPHEKPMELSPAVAPPPAAAVPPPAAAPRAVAVMPPAATPRAVAVTPAQQRAMRAYCRGDFVTHCPGVPPGSREALVCLKRHMRELSAACRGVVVATAPAPRVQTARPFAMPRAEPGMAMGRIENLPMQERLTIIRMCGTDRKTLCSGERPGGGRIIVCLAEHRREVSPRCGAALARAIR